MISICTNGEVCAAEQGMVTCIENHPSSGCQHINARWDSSIKPQHSSADGGTWTFLYNNGDEYAGGFAPTFICDENRCVYCIDVDYVV